MTKTCLVLILVTGAAAQGDGPLDVLTARFEKTGAKKTRERRNLLLKIGDVASPEAFAWLKDAYSGERNARTRRDMLEAMGNTRQRDARDFLRDIIEQKAASAPLRRAAMTRLDRLGFDWRRFLAGVMQRHADRATRSDAAWRIARAADRASLETLTGAWRFANTELKTVLIAASSRYFPIDDLYATMISPSLTAQSEPVLRQAALKALSDRKDRRFFKHVRALAAKEQDTARLAQWVTWCAAFDDEAGIKMQATLVAATPDPRLVRAMATSVERMKSAEVTEWFRTNAGSGRGWLGLAAARHLARHGAGEPVRKALVRIARTGGDEAALTAIGGLERFKGERAERDVTALWSHKKPMRAATALRTYWKLRGGDAEAVKACVKAAGRSTATELRVVALELLKRKHAAAHRALFEKNTEHDRWQVRVAAYDGLTYVRDHRSVEILLARLKEERGRPQYDLIGALADLTGFDWGPKEERWRSWWNRTKKGFKLPKKPDAAKRAQAGASYARYYGLAVRSERVVFVIDGSGSMGGKVKGGKTKMEAAKTALIEVMKKFGTNVKFNIIVFKTGFSAYRPTLVKATRREVDRAIKWVTALGPGGATNIHDSLQAALAMDEVDTVYLLSDGYPTAGKVTQGAEITRIISRENGIRRIAIHTVSITGNAGVNRFMRTLAEKNFGESAAGK